MPAEITGDKLYLALFRQTIGGMPCARSCLIVASNDASARSIVTVTAPHHTELTLQYLGAYDP